VNGAEIAERIHAMMGNESLRVQAMFIREEEDRKKFLSHEKQCPLFECLHLYCHYHIFKMFIDTRLETGKRMRYQIHSSHNLIKAI
jgi:hypothetical protein